MPYCEKQANRINECKLLISLEIAHGPAYLVYSCAHSKRQPQQQVQAIEMLIHAVLGFTLLETLVLAAVLLAWADRVAGARLLAAFLVGFSLWMTGNELPHWLGPDSERMMMLLLSTAPLTSTLFFHFCVVFCGANFGRVGLKVVLAVAYALGSVASITAMVLVPGHMVLRQPIGWVAMPDTVGLVASTVWVVLGIAGVAVLVRALLHARRAGDGQKFRQVAAVTASCLWGMLCLTGYGIAVLALPVYPFPLLGLPLYSLILVYGILRYGVFVANAWARRALVWALLLALGAVVLALTPLLPFESRWLGGLAVGVSVLALNGPVRRMAERLVYPGGEVSVADLGAWRNALQSAETQHALAEQAAALLSARIGTPVLIRIDHAGDVPRDVQAAHADQVDHLTQATFSTTGVPQLVCAFDDAGWTTTLHGWDAAPPGPRHVAELFGTVVAEAAARVRQAQQFAARERERQLQARLAELGSLAATVAHDIRNPLNIISMAVATAPAETRREVADQVARVANLARDLLDYAKPWKLAISQIDLAAQVRAAVMRLGNVRPGSVTLGSGLDQPLPMRADAQRVDQVLNNLLENARIAIGDASASHAAVGDSPVHIDAEATATAMLLYVCDNGPGVPTEIRDRLFEPFASRSPGGTGLGLAIVARIMAAHGGSVALTDHPPWRTCFTLQFPLVTV